VDVLVDGARGGDRRGRPRGGGCDDGRDAEAMREVHRRVYDVQTIDEVVRHRWDDGGGMVTISGRLGTLLPAEGEGGGAPRYALTFSLSDGDDDGNGGDGGRGLKFELRVEGGGKEVATTTTTTMTTRMAATGGNADYDVCDSRDDNESHGRVAWSVPSTAGAGSSNCDDCAVNSAHLFFRQNGSESYFGLGGRTSRPALCGLKVQVCHPSSSSSSGSAGANGGSWHGLHEWSP
jgi:hypothetical protein